jgi:hypothetical protein
MRSDNLNLVIRTVSITTGVVGTLGVTDAGGEVAHLWSPGPLALRDGFLYVADGLPLRDGFLYVADGPMVRRIFLATRMMSTLFGATSRSAVIPGPASSAAISTANGLAIDSAGALWLTSENALLRFAAQ